MGSLSCMLTTREESSQPITSVWLQLASSRNTFAPGSTPGASLAHSYIRRGACFGDVTKIFVVLAACCLNWSVGHSSTAYVFHGAGATATACASARQNQT